MRPTSAVQPHPPPHRARSQRQAVARLLCAFLLAGLGLASAGCRPDPHPPAPRHVLLITVDTLRADHLSAYGYPRATDPALRALAADGVLFEHAVAQWPKTGTSFASMWTGQFPQTTGITHDAAVTVPDSYLTVPELMQHHGFTTAAVVSNAVLSRELGWDRGFDEYLETWREVAELPEDPVAFRRLIDAGRVNRLALPLLERHRDTERLFLWVHYSDPHAPYLLPQGVDNPFLGDRWYGGDGDGGDRKADLRESPGAAIASDREDGDELRFYVAQYDANVRFADEKLGELLAAARSAGLLDNALVIFTADHGESLGEHGYFFGHGRLPYRPGAHVPLVIAWPEASWPAGVRREEPVELVDLYPTLRDLVAPGAEVPGLEGHSLVDLLRGSDNDRGGDGESDGSSPHRLAFAEAGGGSPTTHYRTVEDERWKLVYHPAVGDSPKLWELYDLDGDPGETENLVAARPDQTRRLRRELLEWSAGDWIRAPRSQRQEHDEETRRALKALGYLQ